MNTEEMDITKKWYLGCWNVNKYNLQILCITETRQKDADELEIENVYKLICSEKSEEKAKQNKPKQYEIAIMLDKKNGTLYLNV